MKQPSQTSVNPELTLIQDFPTPSCERSNIFRFSLHSRVADAVADGARTILELRTSTKKLAIFGMTF